jgi:hypothetical protein
MIFERTSEDTFLALSGLLFIRSAAVTVISSRSMSEGHSPLSRGWAPS